MDPQHPNIENENSIHWFKAGIGLKYLRDGLFPFCDTVVRQHHDEILDTVKSNNSLSKVSCDECSVDSLIPSHKKDKSKHCPIGLKTCNCCKNKAGLRSCRNNVCGDIYDIILNNYQALPKPPFWSNTNAHEWCSDPWAIAKCFIPIPGYGGCEAKDIDATGLLSLIINDLYFRKNTNQIIDGNDPLSKVKENRNAMFHSSSMELDKAVSDCYIDDMISALEYLDELKTRDDAKAAVKKLKKLKQQDYIITKKLKLQVLSERVKAIMSDSKNLDERVKSLESDRKEDEQILKEIRMAHDYQKSKLEFQTKLIGLYRDNVLQVNSMPFQSDDDNCAFQDVYVDPHIILKSHSDKRRDTEVTSMSDVFMRDGKPVKSIFVYGEAGSGKTSFCLNLVNDWCLAHSQEESSQNDSRGIKEMRKFDFVFYVSLRHCQGTQTIHDMIIKQFKDNIINDLLNKESNKILIILDGTDEWTANPFAREHCDQFQIRDTPERDYFKEYTVIETARLRKRMTKNKSEQTLEIKGISRDSLLDGITKTMCVIETHFERKEDPRLCENDLEDVCFEEIKYIPIMLQLLICLWYDNELVGTSKSELFAKIIMFYFDWHHKKDQKTFQYKEMESKMCRLAYQTFLNRKTIFTCDHTTVKQSDIPYETLQLILKLGILSREKGPLLYASEHPKELYSFVHKSIQEFLCALHLSNDSTFPQNVIKDNFLKEKSVLEILEYANMFIFLFGLKPEISDTLSTSIYEICGNDARIKAYREDKGYQSEHGQIVADIQTFILNSVTEIRKSQHHLKPRFHLGDMIIDNTLFYDEFFCRNLREECVIPDSVLSMNISINRDDENVCNIFKYLAKCSKLEMLCIQLSDDYPSEAEDVHNMYASFDINALHLKAMFLSFDTRAKYSVVSKAVIRKLPSMDKLVAINMEGVILEEEDSVMFCKLISEKTILEMISLKMVFRSGTRPTLDLHKHQSLKYLSFDNAVDVKFAECLNLTVFKFSDVTSSNFKSILESLKSKEHLKELELRISVLTDQDKHLRDELVKSLTQLETVKLH